MPAKGKYKEMSVKIKEAMGNEKAGCIIRNIRSTREGDVLIITDRKDAPRTTDAIEKSVTLHINGLDALAKKEDVLEAVHQIVPEDK